MDQSPESLLDRLRRDGSQQDWTRFVDLYGPLLQFWARRLLPADDAADLIQDVLLLVLQKFPSFRGEEDRSFLAWLRKAMLNRWRDLGRRAAAQPETRDRAVLEAVAGADGLDEVEARDARNLLVNRALKIMQSDFEPKTWRMCWDSVAAGLPAEEVAIRHEVSIEVVYAASYRVIQRLRSELACAWI
jgi:RNA polymerase sigma-70 factor (ECF subfamily)